MRGLQTTAFTPSGSGRRPESIAEEFDVCNLLGDPKPPLYIVKSLKPLLFPINQGYTSWHLRDLGFGVLQSWVMPKLRKSESIP